MDMRSKAPGGEPSLTRSIAIEDVATHRPVICKKRMSTVCKGVEPSAIDEQAILRHAHGRRGEGVQGAHNRPSLDRVRQGALDRGEEAVAFLEHALQTLGEEAKKAGSAVRILEIRAREVGRDVKHHTVPPDGRLTQSEADALGLISPRSKPNHP